MGIRVDKARGREALAQVFEFRYRVYVEELGIDTPEADHQRRWLRDRQDAYSTSWMLLQDDEVVGSLRTTILSEVPDSQPLIERYQLASALENFSPAEIVITSRFMLDPRLRGGMAVLKLMRAPYLHGVTHGVRLNYGDCSPHLIPLYEKMGFRQYGSAFDDKSYGFKIPILMLLGDRSHFERIRSPVRNWAADRPEDADARAWFKETFPDALVPTSASLLPEGEFLEILTARLASDPVHTLGLLHGLDREEANQFLARATLVKAEPGNRILRHHETGDAFFVLVSGLAEVIQDGRPLRLLGAGDPFGEIALLTGNRRSADVVARTACEAIVLSMGSLTSFVSRTPLVAAKVLLNLSRILAERLSELPPAESANAQAPPHRWRVDEEG